MGLSSLLAWRSANFHSFQPQIVPLLGSVLDEVFIICVFRSCGDTLSGDQLFANGEPYQITSVTLALLQAYPLWSCALGWWAPTCREQGMPLRTGLAHYFLLQIG